jgi:hypothetical protein
LFEAASADFSAFPAGAPGDFVAPASPPLTGFAPGEDLMAEIEMPSSLISTSGCLNIACSFSVS